MSSRLLSAALIAATSLIVSIAASAQLPSKAKHRKPQPTDCWEIHSLGTFGGDQSVGLNLNDAGQVIGTAMTEPRVTDPNQPPQSVSAAFISAPNGGALTEIAIPGAYVHPTAINAAGQVVGDALIPNAAGSRAFVTDVGGANPRFTLNARARDINNVGQTLWDFEYPYYKSVVGPSDQPAGSDGIGLVEVDVLPSTLPLADRFVWSNGLNDAGQVSVVSYGWESATHPAVPQVAYRWSSYEGAIPLVTDATYSNAHGINDIGQVIGIINNDGINQTFVTRRHSTELAILPTYGYVNYPLGVNNYSQVVGMHYYENGMQYAYVTAPFTYHREINLDALREVADAGWTKLEVTAINNRGQITGYGLINNAYRAFLLTPLSPQAYAPVEEEGSQAKCYRLGQ
jgi:uncharacterized membrane protein